MPINGIITGKLRNLDRVVGHLKSLRPLQAETLNDWVVTGAVERNLQVAVEIMIDVCHRLHSLAGRPPASSAREALEGCVELGVLESASTYSKMIGFRNLIVHAYEYVDTSILLDVINNHLADFEKFRQEVLSYVESR